MTLLSRVHEDTAPINSLRSNSTFNAHPSIQLFVEVKHHSCSRLHCTSPSNRRPQNSTMKLQLRKKPPLALLTLGIILAADSMPAQVKLSPMRILQTAMQTINSEIRRRASACVRSEVGLLFEWCWHCVSDPFGLMRLIRVCFGLLRRAVVITTLHNF